MAKKNKGLIIIILILIIGGVYLYKKEYSVTYPSAYWYDSKSSCDTGRSNWMALPNGESFTCSECIQFTQEMYNCYGYSSMSEYLNKWFFQYTYSSCSYTDPNNQNFDACIGGCDGNSRNWCDINGCRGQRIRNCNNGVWGDWGNCELFYPVLCENQTNGCNDDCTLGSKQCSGSGYQTCGNYDSDSCTEWSTTTSCATGQTCSGGVCSGGDCTDTCSSKGYVCGTQTICGSSANCGICSTGICSKGQCITTCLSGTTKCSDGICKADCSTTTPPANKCPDGSTPEFYQDVKKGCKTSTLVWIIGGFIGFMFLMMMMSGMKK